MSGYPADSFLFPLLLSASVLTFLLSLTIAMSANEDEIRADATLSERLVPETASYSRDLLGKGTWSFIKDRQKALPDAAPSRGSPSHPQGA